VSESTLSVGLPELRQAVGYYLGMGHGVDVAWTASQILEIDGVVQSGIRRVYYPPAINANVSGYEWSWLRPDTTIAISVAGGYDYDLPDDFGRLIGVLHYAKDKYLPSLVVVAAGKIQDMRAAGEITGPPTYAATRYKSSTGAAGQKQEIIFFPTPDASYTLSYEYEAYNGALTVSYPYPLGGMQLAELYIESCLALAESRIHDEVGIHMQQYQALLVDAISRDRKRGAQTYGKMGQPETVEESDYSRRYSGPVYPITYKGMDI
jgi:hypothetical protein